MSEWFEVSARVKIPAADGEDAIKRVQALLEPGVRDYGLYLVASFDARRCGDPMGLSGQLMSSENDREVRL